MILLCGIPSEPPLARVGDQLSRQGIPFAFFNQRHFAETELNFQVAGPDLSGTLRVNGQRYRLEALQGVYIRLMDDQLLPELQNEPENSPLRRSCRQLHDTLTRWLDLTQARVVNRIAPMGSNFSKPYQAQLIRAEGFEIPETLITNDPELVLAFRDTHKRVIYKSISGIRSIVQMLEDSDITRLDRIRWCPTQFQVYIEGYDVRVHVVGEAVFATRVTSEATDYRYSQRQTQRSAELEAIELPADLAQRCVNLAKAMGLAFAGIDLRLAPDGRAYCFEVNPSPAYNYYEANTGQPISQAVARYLAA